MLRLALVCHGPTAATRRAAFPADEPPEAEALARLAAPACRPPRADRAFTSPLLRARRTAQALALDAEAAPELRDLDHGLWAGRAMAEIAAADPRGLEAFIREGAAPPGGETVAALQARVAAWITGQSGASGHVAAVTHAAVVRAAVLFALEAPPAAFWRIDVEPLSVADLRFDGRRWALRALNLSLADRL